MDSDSLMEHHAISLRSAYACKFLLNLLLFTQVNKGEQGSRQNSQLNYKPPFGQRDHTYTAEVETDLHSILEFYYRKLQLIMKRFLL